MPSHLKKDIIPDHDKITLTTNGLMIEYLENIINSILPSLNVTKCSYWHHLTSCDYLNVLFAIYLSNLFMSYYYVNMCYNFFYKERVSWVVINCAQSIKTL